MKNTINFERGKSPKEGMGIGIEGMKEKYHILVIESEFNDLDSKFGSVERIMKNSVVATKKIMEAHFVIVHNKRGFMLVKMRYMPVTKSHNSSLAIWPYLENTEYPIKDLNNCIIWLAESADDWGHYDNTDSYGFKI